MTQPDCWSGERGPTATLLVPSYRRPDALLRCLDAICRGTRLPDQIVVVLHDTDEQSRSRLRQWLDNAEHAQLVDIAHVSAPGQAAATNAGLQLARGDVICFIDDDTRPTEQWLGRLLSHYGDPTVVGVGGRDIVHHGDTISAEPSSNVGRITWYGRMIGNHHQPGFDEPVEVDHLKGANMSFRREVLEGFDRNIIGAHLTDTDVSLTARRGGGRLIYDPHASVHHYPAPRATGFARQPGRDEEMYADAHDWAYVMCKHLAGPRRLAFLLFALAVGQDQRYGLLRMLARLPVEHGLAARRWLTAVRGLVGGCATLRRMNASHAGPPG